MNINDIHRYLQRRGPGGYHLAAADMPDEVLKVLIDYMGVLDDIMQPTLDIVQLHAQFTHFVEVLADVERLLPAPEAEAMVNHHVVHIYEQLLDGGPLWTYWTYVFERFMSNLVRSITDRSRMYIHNCTQLYTIVYVLYTILPA
jgi:hypothetical protein